VCPWSATHTQGVYLLTTLGELACRHHRRPVIGPYVVLAQEPQVSTCPCNITSMMLNIYPHPSHPSHPPPPPAQPTLGAEGMKTYKHQHLSGYLASFCLYFTKLLILPTLTKFCQSFPCIFGVWTYPGLRFAKSRGWVLGTCCQLTFWPHDDASKVPYIDVMCCQVDWSEELRRGSKKKQAKTKRCKSET
jgi:hypothetical protein